jgi:hypothetical protein
MKMLRMTALLALSPLSVVHADVPVIDKKNYEIAKQTADTTTRILDTNSNILKTVEDTLKAVTGDRGSTSQALQNLAVGQGFSVTSMPSLDSLIKGGVPDFGNMSGDISKVATTFINGLQLVNHCPARKTASFPATSPTSNWSIPSLVFPP